MRSPPRFRPPRFRPPRPRFPRRRALLPVALLLAALPLLAGATLRGQLALDEADGVNVVTYHARDPLSSWSGTAPVGALELTLDADDLSASALRVTVPADRFDSGNAIRDTNARRTVFESSEHPEIVFEATAVRAETNALPDGARREVTLRGELTLHGVTREIETTAEVRRDGDRLEARGGFSVLLSEFEMSRPSFFGVTVEDEVRIEYAVAADLAP